HQRTALAAAATPRLFAAGERIVKQSDAGDSMFVLTSGAAVVTLEPGNREVARVVPGGFFREMSLLTGEPRTATVRTTVDSEVLEITVDSFRRFVLANPAVVDEVGRAVIQRPTTSAIPPLAREALPAARCRIAAPIFLSSSTLFDGNQTVDLLD